MTKSNNIVIHNETLKTIAIGVQEKYYASMPSLDCKDKWLKIILKELGVKNKPKLNPQKHPKNGIIIPLYVIEELAKENNWEMSKLPLSTFDAGEWAETILDCLEKKMRIEI